VVSSIGIDPIEKKPVYHYLPGSLCFSMGSFGCNFRCNFCQNWNIAYADGTQIADPDENRLSPEKAVELALENKCRSISWTYNEPSIWLEYTIDCARLAKENGLRTVYVTNGYMTPEALDMIAPYLDVFRVDIKSFDNKFYQKLIKIPGIQGILNNTINAKKKWNMHVETVTNIIPGWNDSDKNLKAIAEWIYENLGELTPWHVTRFFPQAKMMDIEPTPPETLQRARQIGLDTGLKFVYTGNIASGDHSTYCPSCRKKVIDREGYSTRVTGVTGEGECTNCNYDLGIVNF
jgi:pyruvate formate lyase activating enzyme